MIHFADRLAEAREKWEEQSDADRADIIFQIEQRAQEQVGSTVFLKMLPPCLTMCSAMLGVRPSTKAECV